MLFEADLGCLFEMIGPGIGIIVTGGKGGNEEIDEILGGYVLPL